ncbi:MAG: hypothetical protein JJT96_13110 [Opitutales bacterium]|nr:hypothetical protein [Opitutales bacterium]
MPEPTPNPKMTPEADSEPPLSLLYSRIGYGQGRPPVLVLRGAATAAVGKWTLGGEGTVLHGDLPHGDLLWGDTWRVLKLPPNLGCGHYRLEVTTGDHSAALSAEFEVAPDLLWDRTWQAVSYEQAERRERFSEKHRGKPLGWFDAGMHWQEANAHAAYLVGLCDVLELRHPAMDAAEAGRLLRQLLNGARYLALLQDLGKERSGEGGPLVHQSFKIDHILLPADAPRAAVAWARVADLLPPAHAGEAEDFRQRARRALDWFLQKPRQADQPGCGIPHGIQCAWARPPEFTTSDLAQCVEAAFLLQDKRVFSLADQWLDRQLAPAAADEQDGLYGNFRLFATGPLTEKAWTHGFDPDGHGFNCGQTVGHHLTPLVGLLGRHPDHPQAGRWRRALEHFAYGYFLPACHRNPFQLAPLGWFEGEGLLHFAGLWHGCNGLYGRMAAQALDFADFFNDPAFEAVAEGNLQWIAGLNAGLRRDQTTACHLSTPEAPEVGFVPVSMIHGIGQRTAGSWLNLRGAICNGFSTGDQFVWDTEVRLAADGPTSFTDEDWITHAGGWLSGIARMENPDRKELSQTRFTSS